MGTDLREDLLRWLAQTVSLLENAGEEHWAAWLRTDLARLQRGDGYGLDHLLRAYGGMGSINDLVLSRDNGHAVEAEDEARLNADLRMRLSDIYTAADSLR